MPCRLASKGIEFFVIVCGQKGYIFMESFEYTITDAHGLHARPAGLLVKEAAKYNSDIALVLDGKECDAKRLFGIMGMGIKCGNKITVRISGSDEDDACEKLKFFFENNL